MDNSEDDLLSGQLIRFNEEPVEQSWKLPGLYNDGAGGGTLIWQIGFDGKSLELVIKHGMIMTSLGEPGTIQEKRHPVVTNSSARSIKEQSLLEARRRYTNKYKNGYYPARDELPKELRGCKPMLANKYRPPTEEKGSNITRFPVSTMPKLDGIRALMKKEGNEVVARSRLNNKFENMEHIKTQILEFYIYLPEGAELDGELYNHEMEFTKLTSAVKTVKKRHKQHDDVMYYIYDIIEPKRLSWPYRHDVLKCAYRNYIRDHPKEKERIKFHIVPQEIAMNHEKIFSQLDKYLDQGYEGIIIRHCLGLKPTAKDKERSQYRPDRSNNLLKYKLFKDKEVEIIGGQACVGTEEGAVKFRVRDEEGREFEVRPRGTMEKRRKWFNELDKIIGKKITIKYQEESVHNIPRFAVGIAIRDYE